MGISIITPSCHRSLGGQGYSSGWMKITITATQRGIRLCIARSPVMQTSGASMSANTHSPDLKISRNMSGANCLKRYRPVPASRATTINIFSPDENDLAGILWAGASCESFPRSDRPSCLLGGGADRSTVSGETQGNKTSGCQETFG